MDSKILRGIIELTIEGKQYVLTPLCLFHDIPTLPVENGGEFRYEIVRRQFGLKDLNQAINLHEEVDPKKFMLAKIKNGV